MLLKPGSSWLRGSLLGTDIPGLSGTSFQCLTRQMSLPSSTPLSDEAVWSLFLSHVVDDTLHTPWGISRLFLYLLDM